MTLTPEVADFLDRLKRSGHVPTDQQPSPEAARQESLERRSRLMIEAPPMESIEDLRIATEDGEITLRCYIPPPDRRSGATTVWLHGGGFVVGDIDAAHAECARIAHESGSALVSVDYRLAPEHRFPAATRDCQAALAWAAEHIDTLGGDPNRLVVGGVSSGGNLAAIVAQQAARDGGPALAAQILVVAGLDLRLATDSWRRLGDGYLLTRTTCEWYLAHYLNPGDRAEDPALSPGLAPDSDLVGLPPTLIVTAEYDPLRDEALAYATRLRALGVPVEHVDYAGVIHGFLGQLGPIPESEAAFATIGATIRRAVSS